jgi:hypothetical protein
VACAPPAWESVARSLVTEPRMAFITSSFILEAGGRDSRISPWPCDRRAGEGRGDRGGDFGYSLGFSCGRRVPWGVCVASRSSFAHCEGDGRGAG